jgi:nucleotide-binding universal stress UspA family protein
MGSCMFSPKSILVPTDFSSYAHHALGQAMDIASKYHAQVFLFHVIDEHITQCVVDFCLSETLVNQMKKRNRETMVDKLQHEINSVSDHAVDVEISSGVKSGIPYEEILKEQEEKEIDLIVMASHGRTGIVKNLIGSVAEKVVRGAKCPVMLIRS